MLGGVGSTSRRSGWEWDALPEAREASGVPLGGSGGVECPYLISGKGREALPEVLKAPQEVREGSGNTEVQQALPRVLEGSGGSPGGPGGVRSPSWWSGRVQEALPEVREALPKVWEGSGGPS